MPEYFSFEDVLGELQLDEEELKRMVSEGELRAFRDENKMKFRKDDVENLKKGRITEPTIVLPTPARGSDKPTQEEGETILDFASDAAAPAVKPDDTAVPAIDVGAGGGGEAATEAASETAAGETTGITEEMIFEDSDLTVPKEEGTGTSLETSETMVEGQAAGEGGEQTTGLTTEPLKIQEDSGTATQEEGTAASAGEGAGEEEAAPRPGRRAARPAARPMAAKKGSPVLTGVLGFAALILVFTGVIAGEYMMIEGEYFRRPEKAWPVPSSKSDYPSGFAFSVGSFALKIFGDADKQDQIWWEKFEAEARAARK